MWHGLTRAVQMWASLGVEAGVNTMLLVVDSEMPWRLMGLPAYRLKVKCAPLHRFD